jgi:hypothetical protein
MPQMKKIQEKGKLVYASGNWYPFAMDCLPSLIRNY